ncbi:MAG: type II toxin-antitoxin system HicB family antitoxin [Sulfuricellaceae bacterium]|nr:type II toxin-antitoxin system HicB family antitoxin [Sulfuricellaceae bacterium]
MDIRYPATIEQQDTGFFVQFVDLPDTFTEGSTLEEALFNAAEVLSAMLDWHLDHGHLLPDPSIGLKSAHYIAPDAKTQAALLVRRARGSRPLSEVARAMQTSWPAAQRLEDPSHSPSLKQLERAAAALGKRLVLSFE